MKIDNKVVFIVFYILILLLSKKRYYSILPTIPLYPDNKKDADIVKEISDKRTQQDVKFAELIDNGLTIPFSKLLPVPLEEINSVANSTNFTIIILKLLYNRARPKQINSSIKTLNSISAMTPAYPSGHAFQSYYLAKTYSKRFPYLKKELWKLADKCSFARVHAGLHYPSDGAYSKYLVNTFF